MISFRDRFLKIIPVLDYNDEDTPKGCLGFVVSTEMAYSLLMVEM